MEKYMSDPESILHNQSPSELPAALLLYSVLALAARFSPSTYFHALPPVERGESFSKLAKVLYLDSLRTLQTPTLEYLQGCTLLAFYLYLAGPDSQGWLIIGMCSRLAYDLRIDTLDVAEEDDAPRPTPTPDDPPAMSWRQQEELRRIWWSIWELDTFASAIACRPHTIDRTKIGVKLPVSDDAWFSDTPVESAVIDPDPQHAWRALSESPNQDERAWFLLINYLLLTAHDLGQQRKPDPDDVETIENAVACYNLILPSHFHLDADPESLSFNNENFCRCNWIVSTNIMLQG
jgi:hypothetical protein